jgi:lipid-binding SYLF domain-containing protein
VAGRSGTTARPGFSYGLQAGAQQFGYALFFMNDNAVRQLDKADGFEVGVAERRRRRPGHGEERHHDAMSGDIYAFVFSQKGLMAGLGLQGNKVKRIAAK